MRAEAGLCRMARAGVVYADPTRCLQPATQDVLRFGDEAVMLRCEQALQLPLRDRHAHRSQQHQQPWQRRLSLMVVHQHKATQFGAEMPRKFYTGEGNP